MSRQKRFHTARSEKGSSRKKRISAYKSSSLFWIGVPVRQMRRGADRLHTALDCHVRDSLTMCASSSTMRNHSIRWHVLGASAVLRRFLASGAPSASTSTSSSSLSLRPAAAAHVVWFENSEPSVE